MADPSDVAAGLLESAREDAEAARLMAEAEVPNRIVGFHVQQSVEMFLKAVLSSHGVGYERTHDIERLTSLLAESAMELPADFEELAQLTPWAVERRYGDPFDPQPLDRHRSGHLVVDATRHRERWCPGSPRTPRR